MGLDQAVLLDLNEIDIFNVPGLLGSPTGTSWYLAPVTPTEHGYALTGRTAAGYHTATLPQLPDIDAPYQVKVHDFPI